VLGGNDTRSIVQILVASVLPPTQNPEEPYFSGISMDLSIAAILAQDGITSGAIYALLALALVLVFSVTRVIFIPQGEFVAFGALTLAAMQSDMFPHSATLLLALGVLTFVQETIAILRIPERRLAAARSVPLAFAKFILFPAAIYALTKAVADPTLPLVFQVLLTLAIVVPMGPMIYRLAFQPLAEATTLVLLIVSVGVHFALLGLGLVMFGAEGSRSRRIDDFGPKPGDRRRIVRVDRCAVSIFRTDLVGQGVARYRSQPPRRAPGRHRRHPGGPHCLYTGRSNGRLVWRVDRTVDDRVLRQRFPNRLERIRRRDHRRPGQLSDRSDRRAAGRPARIVFIILGQRLEGSDRVYADHPSAAVALIDFETCR
jgi:uncharacterized membrane protein (UPF0136 family)